MTPPTLQKVGHLMLAAFGERSTLEDFKVACDLRPELDFTVEQCQEGLDALVAAGVLRQRNKTEWEITKLGHEVLAAPREEAVGPPSEVLLDPEPGVATTSSEAT